MSCLSRLWQSGKRKLLNRPSKKFQKFISSGLTLADLRHSYAVAALRAGDDIKTVQGNLGHHTASFTLDVYGHVTEEMKQDSADRMERFIKGVSGL